MKKTTKVLLSVLLIVSVLMAVTACTPDVISKDATSVKIVNGKELVINETITLKAEVLPADSTSKVTFSLKQPSEIVVLEGDKLTSLAQGKVTVVVKAGTVSSEMEFTVSPYTRVCGADTTAEIGNPVIVWVDFNATNKQIVAIELVGLPTTYTTTAAYGEKFAKEYESLKSQFIGIEASKVSALTIKPSTGATKTSDSFKDAVADASARFLAPASFEIRPYQSAMTGRYIANNPYFKNIAEDRAVTTRVVASYPQDCAVVETNDVMKNATDIKWVKGVNVASFKVGEKKFNVSHNVVKAVKPGIALIEYKYNDETVLCALDIYENFTIGLSGSDSYGKVVREPADKTAKLLTYRVLGDKAMNFAGGTCGSTVIDVTIDKETRKIQSVRIVAHSDSTYLANAWEYGGSYVEVGNQIYDMAVYLAKFSGIKVDEQIVKYALSTKEVVGGIIVTGGINQVVTGATRTSNAIIAAVNAGLAQFVVDFPAK